MHFYLWIFYSKTENLRVSRLYLSKKKTFKKLKSFEYLDFIFLKIGIFYFFFRKFSYFLEFYLKLFFKTIQKLKICEYLDFISLKFGTFYLLLQKFSYFLEFCFLNYAFLSINFLLKLFKNWKFASNQTISLIIGTFYFFFRKFSYFLEFYLKLFFKTIQKLKICEYLDFISLKISTFCFLLRKFSYFLEFYFLNYAFLSMNFF